MSIPFLDTNADEVAARIRSLVDELNAMRQALVDAGSLAGREFRGPEADAFAERHAVVLVRIDDLERQLSALVPQVLAAGDAVYDARRDAAAALLGPGGILLNDAAEWLGL